MKELITILFAVSILTASAQDLDPKYYLFGRSFDYSISTYPGKRLERQKLNIQIRKSDTGRVLRLAEITKKEFKNGKTEKDCGNKSGICELKNAPWRLGDFYNFTYVKEKGTRPKQVTGTVKRELIDNASDNQMKSYLAGIYFEIGSMHGDTIEFQFGHVIEKLQIARKFIDSLDGAEYLKIITVEKGMMGGGPLLLLVPKGELKQTFLNERNRINTLANNT